ncbi:putative Universal stress protein UspA [Azospirillaceae bacterium]
MSLKTILVHVTSDEQSCARLKVAAALSRKFHAFLDIVSIVAEGSERESQIEQDVRGICKECSYSWKILEGNHVEHLAERSFFSDLAIISQTRPTSITHQPAFDDPPLYLPEKLPLAAACPTLILPWNWSGATPAHHILLAWRHNRETARAVHETLPILQAAERVTILTVASSSEHPISDVDIAVFLDRHGVANHCLSEISHEGDEDDVILRTAREHECDAVIIGVQGSSRWRDLIMGNATGALLEQTDIPIIMSH